MLCWNAKTLILLLCDIRVDFSTRSIPADTPGVRLSLLSDAWRVRLGSLAHWSLFGVWLVTDLSLVFQTNKVAVAVVLESFMS